MRTVAVVQARMGSARLPGKVLRDVAGRPVLQWLLVRAARATLLDEIVVATTREPEDAPLADACERWGFRVVRGERFDVLGRIASAASTASADLVVRLTGDCPLMDPAVVDDVIRLCVSSNTQFAANRLPPPWPRRFPIGLDVEVATLEALQTAAREAVSPAHREHVMPYLYEQPDRFSVAILPSPVDAGAVRWTIDTERDVTAVEPLLVEFGERPELGWLPILDYWRAHPTLAELNSNVQHRGATDVDDRFDSAGEQKGAHEDLV